MEIVQEEKKHECKVCKKRFFSGKSLGGHMRCHVGKNPARRNENHIDSDIGFEEDDGGGGGGQTGYGLRENPKKSWRISSGSNQTDPKQEEKEEPEKEQKKESICKVCGKGFNSSRALFGHMRHHSKKDILCRECGKGFCSLRALSGHMRCHSKRFGAAIDESIKTTNSQSKSPDEIEIDNENDTSSSCPTRRKRSRRYNKITSIPSSSINFNDSLSLTLSEPELEEGAFCLILLSRAVTSFQEFDDSVSDSSHNNSAPNLVSNGGETSKKKANEIGKVFAVEFLGKDGLRKKKLGETEKKIHSEIKIKTNDLELGNSIDLEPSTSSESLKHNSSKRAKCEPYESDLEGNLCNKKRSSTARNKTIYKCRSCSKIFPSRRGLLGHRIRCIASSRKSFCGRSIQSSKVECKLPDGKANPKLERLEYMENPIEQEVIAGKCELKRIKDFECGICFKVFASGQALGGHKRAHYAAGSSETAEEGTDVSDIFYLNLPCTAAEEGGDHVELKPWCFRGGHHEHEPLVGVISNRGKCSNSTISGEQVSEL